MYIQEIFRDLGIINHIDRTKITIPCLIHNEKRGNSLYINFETNRYQCFGKCQESGNLQQLLYKIGSDTILSSQYLIESAINKELNIRVEKQLEELDFNKHLYFYDSPKNMRDIKYLNDRNLSPEIYQKNKIYLNSYNQRIYIPVMFEGKYYGNITRTIFNEKNTLKHIQKQTGIQIDEYNKKDVLFDILYTDKEEYNRFREYTHITKWHERYLNDFFLPKDRILYEPLTNNPECNVYLLQEGSLDSLFSNQYGYNSYAVIGNGINKFHVDYLMKKLEGKYLIAAFDNDEAGRKYYSKLVKLSNKLILKLDWSLIKRKVKDVADLTKEELDYLVKHANYGI